MATAEEVRQALVKKLEAEAEHFAAEALKNRTEASGLAQMARQAAAQADSAEIMSRQNKRMEDELLAQNKYNLVYNFNGPVGEKSVFDCISQLTEWTRLNPEQDIEIVFNSPGGSIIDGMALFDFIRMLRDNKHHITTSTIGYAASMAGILLQAGDKRVMGRESWILIHEASFMTAGKMGEVEDTVEWLKHIQKRIIAIFAERSHLSPAKITHNWKRKDWWISSDEALKLGLVDQVR